MNSHTNYALRKNGLQQVEAIHPELAEPLSEILGTTFGLIVYQEQVMAVAQKVAGFTLGQADVLRRAMGKKKKSELDKQFADFEAGMQANGYSKQAVQVLWDTLMPFADYAFNKAHSAGYGVLSYWTAYLKANHPAEYMAALLTSVGDSKDKLGMYLSECRRMGIQVLPPDVNESSGDFTAVPSADGVGVGDIRFGLGAVRNVGFGVVEQIRAAREAKGRFTSFHDFLPQGADPGREQAHGRVAHQGGSVRLARLNPPSPPRDPRGSRRGRRADQAQRGERAGRVRLRQPLGRARGRGRPRAAIDRSGPSATSSRSSARCSASTSPTIRSPGSSCNSPSTRRSPIPELISGESVSDGEIVTVAGLLTSVQHRTARNSGNQYGVVQLEDFGGEITVMFLGKTYQEFSPALANDAIVVIKGRVSVRDDGMNLHAVSMFLPDTGQGLGSGPLVISVAEHRATTDVVSALNDVLIRHAGNNEVRLRLVRGDSARMFELPYPVAVTADLYGELKRLLGPNCVV